MARSVSWLNRDLIKLLLLRAASFAAFQITILAVSWQVYLETEDALYLGLIGLSQFVPVLVLAPLGGALADRRDRRVVSASASLAGAIATGALALTAIVADPPFLLFVVTSMAVAGARAFAFPAQSAMVPMVVAREFLGPAVALGSTLNKISMVVGPAVGGVLLVFGPLANYCVAAVLLLMAGALALGVKGRFAEGPGTDTDDAQQDGGLRHMLAGVPFIFSRPVLLAVMSLDLCATLLGGATALLPYYVRDILHAGTTELGLLRAAPALGATLLAPAMIGTGAKHWGGRAMLIAVMVYGGATIVFGLSSNLWLSAMALVVVGMADFVSVVVRQTMVQMMTPDAMRGRVSAIAATFINASNTLGQFESGVVAALIGPVPAVVTGGIGSIMAALVWWRLAPGLADFKLSSQLRATSPG